MDYFDEIKKHPEYFNNENVPFKILRDKNDIFEWQEEREKILESKNLPSTWAKIGIVLEDRYVIAFRDLVEFSDGSRNGYVRLYNRAYLEGGAAGVVVLPVTDGKILLLHHFRHATRAWHWEIPRGFGEPGVSAEIQARAEIADEVGGVIIELIEIGLYYNNTGLEGNPIHLFLAKLKSTGRLAEEEGITDIRWVTLTELEKMIADEEVTDGFTIAAYTRAKLKGLLKFDDVG